jgi:hypothetical protein
MKHLFSSIRSFHFRQLKKLISVKGAFILAGVASTVWFLLRVIPKPQRATYPCMRAAAPIMSSFIIWTLSIVGMGAFYKKAKSNFSKSKYLISGLFVIAFLASMAIFQSQNVKSIFAKPVTPGVMAPIGTGKGIFPGRVAWVYHANAAKWTGSGYFWASGVNNQSAYNDAFTKGLNSISGGTSDFSSWDLMFKWFNNSHGRAGTGYVNGDKIAIKINSNNTAYSGAGGGGMNPNPYACVAIVASLVNAGVPQGDIWIGDPSRAVTDNIFDLIHTAYPMVNVVDYFGNNGRKTTGCTTGDYPNFGKMSTCFATARYMVSLPILKGHPGQNFSFGAKNFFGVGCISNNYANNPHPGGNDWESEYLTRSTCGGRVILWCMDASYPCATLDATPSTNKGANFFMSLDGVAEESVSLDMWNMYFGKGFGGENYIDIAATGGAGVHEHWNNATDKKYTRNIDPNANGIELVYICASCNVPVVAITSPVNGTPFTAGSNINITGTASTPTGTITNVKVYEDGNLLGTATGTTNWSYTWTNVPAAASHKITAVATNTAAATGTSPEVTIVLPINLPAKIEAENFSAMNGIQVETTTDTGGGSNIGYTESGDWLDYLVNVPFTGTYTVDFRVASAVTTGKIELRNQAGTVTYATYAQTTATGGWQVWETHTVNANLTAGVQTLRIFYTGAGLNLNWFEVKTTRILTSITVTPDPTTITVTQTKQFTAVGKDQYEVVMDFTPTWSTTGGTITTSGLYTATTPGTFTVKAQSGTVFGTAQITVNPQILTSIVVSPPSVTLLPGQQKQFTADGKDQNGNPMVIPSLSWNATGGTITPAGLYTAGAVPGNYSVVAQSGSVSGNAAVTISPRVLTTITVTPATAMLTSGQTQQYHAEGKDQIGVVMDIIPPPTWSATGGDIDNDGLYTAGSVNGNYTVTAQSGSVSGNAQVTIGAIDILIQAEAYAAMFGVQTEPCSDEGGGLNVGYIETGDWMTYTVTIPQTGTYSVDFRAAGWTATGRIALQDASNNQLTAANAPNNGAVSYQVWNTVPGENNFQLNAGTQTIRIYATVGSWNLNWFKLKAEEPSVLTSIEVTPSPANVIISHNQQFTATGKDQHGATMVISPAPLWTASGGSISTSGLYTAGSTVGIFNVWAQSGSIVGNAPVIIVEEPILSKIEAENYNLMSGVQIVPIPTGGNVVGYVDVGDWYEYNINVPVTGKYKVTLNLASAIATGAFQIKNGTTVLATIAVPNTGGWFTFTTQSATFNLTQGAQTIRIVATGAGYNLDWLDFEIDKSIKIEAESYSSMFGIQTETTTDVGGGLNVGYTDPGDWMNYSVTTPEAGLYNVNFRVASLVATGKIELRNSAAVVLATLAQGSTGGWQTWITKSVTANLPAGLQTLRIYYTGAGLNINWFELDPTGLKSTEDFEENAVVSEIKNLEVFPNPVSDELHVQNVDQNSTFEVYNLSGRLVLVKKLDSRNNALNVSTLKSGLYILKATGNNKTSLSKFIKR